MDLGNLFPEVWAKLVEILENSTFYFESLWVMLNTPFSVIPSAPAIAPIALLTPTALILIFTYKLIYAVVPL